MRSTFSSGRPRSVGSLGRTPLPASRSTFSSLVPQSVGSGGYRSVSRPVRVGDHGRCGDGGRGGGGGDGGDGGIGGDGGHDGGSSEMPPGAESVGADPL